MIHLVQIGDGSSRRVAIVEEPNLRCLTEVQSVYELVHRCLSHRQRLSEEVLTLAHGETLDYDKIYAWKSDWHLLAPIDVPGEPARLLVSGTGLTHLGSAKDRQAMHLAAAKAAETTTDSMRMFQWGLEGGHPAAGEIGIAPEWFYKGNGYMVRPPLHLCRFQPLPRTAGKRRNSLEFISIGPDGTPYRIGMAAGNEFSDHQFEKRNYLNLAGSKLRTL